MKKQKFEVIELDNRDIILMLKDYLDIHDGSFEVLFNNQLTPYGSYPTISVKMRANKDDE